MAPNRVQATETSVEVLEALARLGEAGVTELANELGSSKANVHKHLKTLESARLVRQCGDEYTLGHRFLDFAATAKETEPVYRKGRSHVAKLAEIAGATATIVVREGSDGVYLHTVSPTDRDTDVPAVGRRIPLPRRASGLAILACYAPDRRRALLSDLAESPDRADALLDRLETVNQRGIAVDDGENGLQEIAAPVTTTDDRPQGAIGLWKPTVEDDTVRVEADLRKLVRKTAARVSNRLTLTE